MADTRITDAEIAGIMGWRGPGANTAASLRKIRNVIDHVLSAERAALASRPAEVDDIAATLNNPSYGQPDLYSRLHTALTNEVELAKKFGKLPQWFDAVRGLVDWLESETGAAPSHTTNKEK